MGNFCWTKTNYLFEEVGQSWLVCVSITMSASSPASSPEPTQAPQSRSDGLADDDDIFADTPPAEGRHAELAAAEAAAEAAAAEADTVKTEENDDAVKTETGDEINADPCDDVKVKMEPEEKDEQEEAD